MESVAAWVSPKRIDCCEEGDESIEKKCELVCRQNWSAVMVWLVSMGTPVHASVGRKREPLFDQRDVMNTREKQNLVHRIHSSIPLLDRSGMRSTENRMISTVHHQHGSTNTYSTAI